MDNILFFNTGYISSFLILLALVAIIVVVVKLIVRCVYVGYDNKLADSYPIAIILRRER